MLWQANGWWVIMHRLHRLPTFRLMRLRLTHTAESYVVDAFAREIERTVRPRR